MRAVVIAALLVALPGIAAAERAGFRVERGQQHAGLPFVLDLIVEGFDESPTPDQPPLEIAGATVTPAGARPSSMGSITIVNGRRVDNMSVTWHLLYQVQATSPGVLRVPATTIRQGKRSALAPAAEIRVESIPSTDEMKLELELPDRPVFVGETIAAQLRWLFIPQPEDQTFGLPLASLDAFTVSSAPVQNPRRAVKIPAGAKELEVEFTVDEVTLGGVKYNRVTLPLLLAPRRAGAIEIPPSSVVAKLQVGRPDFFGRAPTQLFRAQDRPRTLEVKALPESGRPPMFAGAVGEQFSIEVKTSRSVVSLGEPVELAITVKSDQRLDTLALGKLDGEGRLPHDKFTVPEEAPTGELADDGKTKTFKVLAQVTGPATAIPALTFAYFDPKKQQYQTIQSEPIALSVKGGAVVDASDVFAGKKKPATAEATTGPIDEVAADLALSSAGAVDSSPLAGAPLWLAVALLYLVPLALLGFRTWQVRGARAREEAGEVRAARRRVEELLDRAKEAPSREVAGPLVAALRDLQRAIGAHATDDNILARLETEAFAPGAAGAPLSADLRSDAAGLLRRWHAQERRARTGAGAVAVIALLGITANAALAEAGPLEDGRAAYQFAMEHGGDPTARKAAFARAAIALGEAARATPDRPELLADWGTAALQAGDVATATLAYRRALAIDPGNSRAQKNLGYLRNELSATYRPAAQASAADTFLFFHHWTRSRRLLVGAVAFALAVLLLVPWRRRVAGRIALAVPLAAVWIAMSASVLLEPDHGDDAVAMERVVLRAADSGGAPAVLPEPVPRGAEVRVLEHRDAWTRVEIASGRSGWLPDGALAPVIGVP